MIEVGRVCGKLAGRDAGKKCVIVDIIDENYVLIDGETRRRKSNIDHLEFLEEMVKIKKGASTIDVKKAMITAKIKVIEKKKVKRSLKKKKTEEKKKTKKDGK